MFKLPQMPKAVEQSPAQSVITPEADRELSRVLLIYGVIFVLLFSSMPIVMAFVNIPHSPYFALHRFLDTISLLVVMVPFFMGANKMASIRLRWGRLLSGERRWKEAIAALEPFSSWGQKFLDGTGEAHYLLAVALARLNRPADADKARAFVLNHRGAGPWAEKLRQEEAIRARGVSSLERDRTTEPGELRPRAVKGKRRRF